MSDAGDLISGSRVIRNAVDVQLGGIDAGGQKAKGGRSHQQLLEKLHLGLTPREKCRQNMPTRKGYGHKTHIAIRRIQKIVMYRLRLFLGAQTKKLPT